MAAFRWNVAGARWRRALDAARARCAPQRWHLERDLRRQRARRASMVRRQIEARGVHDPRVLAAISAIPRHRFVTPNWRCDAYADRPLPIGFDQTISQPYIVARMTEALELQGFEKALEIGTGSGYQTAVLSMLVREVYSIEIVEELALRARACLAELGHTNVHVRHGDGYRGWPEAAPFDVILIAAAPDHIPEPLLAQLAPGGRMILPVGRDDQELVILAKTPHGIEHRVLLPVQFVPMTGEARDRSTELP